LKAVILAGGKGSRLAPYTKVIPQPLMPIGDMPIMEVLLHQIKRPVVIKTSPHAVPVTRILTNLKTAQIGRERYFELLDQI
jgi:dTDP-glucose pyrophosphorylase